jgi:hypothetical protein
MEEKIDKKESAGKSIMIRLYPNKSRKQELNKWFGTARWTYNQVVASLRASPGDISKYAVVKELRNDFVNKKNSNNEENFADKPWVTKSPYDIRDAALNDVVKAYTSNLAKKDNNNFTIHFKKKRHQVIQLQSMQTITNQKEYFFLGFWRRAYQKCRTTSR